MFIRTYSYKPLYNIRSVELAFKIITHLHIFLFSKERHNIIFNLLFTQALSNSMSLSLPACSMSYSQVLRAQSQTCNVPTELCTQMPFPQGIMHAKKYR